MSSKVVVFRPIASDKTQGVSSSSASAPLTLQYGYFEELYRIPTTQQITSQNSSQGSTDTIYTVPSGFTLYITNITTGYFQTGVTAGAVHLFLNEVESWRFQITGVAGFNNISSNNLPIPFKLDAGQRIKMSSDSATLQFFASIIGFLVQN
jgi:hypothetical protein